MSLNMLIETPSGFDYTGADCAAWMREAGFRKVRVEHLVGPEPLGIGIKEHRSDLTLGVCDRPCLTACTRPAS